jgi:hypothetical protein
LYEWLNLIVTNKKRQVGFTMAVCSFWLGHKKAKVLNPGFFP